MSAPSVAVAERAVASTRQAEFTAFFDAEFPRLAAYCLRLLNDQQLARDVALESLVRVWARWRAVEDPHAYIFVIASKLVRDKWRRSSSRTESFLYMSWSCNNATY